MILKLRNGGCLSSRSVYSLKPNNLVQDKHKYTIKKTNRQRYTG